MIKVQQINPEVIKGFVFGLENFEKDKAIKSGLSAAGSVFKAGGIRRLKQRMKSGSGGVTGNLNKSFTVRVKRSKLGALIGFKSGNGGGSHANLVDRGTTERFWKTRNGKSSGKVIGNAFWVDTEREDYPEAMDKLYTGIERAVNRIKSRV